MSENSEFRRTSLDQKRNVVRERCQWVASQAAKEPFRNEYLADLMGLVVALLNDEEQVRRETAQMARFVLSTPTQGIRAEITAHEVIVRSEDGDVLSVDGLPEVGSKWIWEKGNPHAHCNVRVVEVTWNGEEWWVQSELTDGKDTGKQYWNELDRWWEAATP